MTVRLTTEALPPLYAVRAVTWGDGTPRRPAVLGMRICVIPWMKGMIIVPRDAGI